MPSLKRPCLQCKEKHVKCDEAQPQCRRCQLRRLPCTRPERKTIFRHGTAAGFAKGQKWVLADAKSFLLDEVAKAETLPVSSEGNTNLPPSAQVNETGDGETLKAPGDVEVGVPENDRYRTPCSSSFHQWQLQRPSALLPEERTAGHDTRLPTLSNLTGMPSLGEKQGSILSSRPKEPSIQHLVASQSYFATLGHERPCSFPLDNLQEACLLRYFVEELAHWFDLCDGQRHFQLVVPYQARQYPHLLHAIFALSARHLSRVPWYKTPKGIVYHGQLLPGLNESVAVEYMLQCIPALRQFRDDQDDEYRGSVIASAVILRQLEEIDDDELDSREFPAVNFLAVIDSVLRSSNSRALSSQGSLIQASYWMALRQEIFQSFTKRHPPQMFLAPECWQDASGANKTVVHTVQVARWLWGSQSESEWSRLMQQQEHLEKDILVDFRPIYRRSADRSKGEIFPTTWYASNTEVVSMLLATTSKMVLCAENPALRTEHTSRASWRNAENEVRLLTLELCGIALCNSASTATLVNAAIGIQLYGDYFADPYERQALKEVIERYRDAYAWPVQELLEKFQ